MCVCVAIPVRVNVIAFPVSLVTVRYCVREDAISCKDSQLFMPSVSPVAVRNDPTDWRLRSKNKPRRDDVSCSRPQPTTPLAANQRADRVAQPGAIIPPVLELLQARWRQSSRRWLRRRSPVYSKSSYAAGTLESSEGGVLECKSQKNACLFSCKRPAP